MPKPSIDLPSSRSFTLPNREAIVVAPLQPGDNLRVQDIMANAWDDTYVVPGWLNLQQRRDFVDPKDHGKLVNQADRIREGHERLARGDRKGALYLGAFSAGQLVGFTKVRGYTAPTRLGRIWQSITDRVRGSGIGYIDEIDVEPEYVRLGIGRALALVALEHMQRVGFNEVRLEVVDRNQNAKNFYTKHLGMTEDEQTSPMPGANAPQMRRRLMSGQTHAALGTLRRRNKWLTSRA